jgi:hypothetical protein
VASVRDAIAQPLAGLTGAARGRSDVTTNQSTDDRHLASLRATLAHAHSLIDQSAAMAAMREQGMTDDLEHAR